jgi:hypothetical protein
MDIQFPTPTEITTTDAEAPAEIANVINFLDRAAILGASDLAHSDVYVPQWKGTVRIRTLTARERDAFEASLTAEKEAGNRVDFDNIRARLVALCAIGTDGTRLFTAGDIEALGEKNGGAVDLLFDAARKLAGMTASDVKELEGN